MHLLGFLLSWILCISQNWNYITYRNATERVTAIVICIKKSVKFGHAVPEICVPGNRQTDSLITILRSGPYRREVISSCCHPGWQFIDGIVAFALYLYNCSAVPGCMHFSIFPLNMAPLITGRPSEMTPCCVMYTRVVYMFHTSPSHP